MEIRSFASSSAGNCYYVSDGQTPLLLECGIPIKSIQKHLDFQLSSIAGVLISHEHMDHAKAAKDIMRTGVDIYASVGTASTLGLSGHRLHHIRARHQFHVGSWTILPFDTQHDAKEPLGFLLASGGEKLLFITDSFYCRYRFAGLTSIMIECNHSYEILNRNVESGALPQAMKKRLMQSHFSLERVKEFLQANDLSRVQEIYLLHLSESNSDAVQFKREIQQLAGKPVYIAGE